MWRFHNNFEVTEIINTLGCYKSRNLKQVMLLWDNIFAITVHVFKIKVQSSSFKTQKTLTEEMGLFFWRNVSCKWSQMKSETLYMCGYIYIYNFLKKQHLLK